MEEYLSKPPKDYGWGESAWSIKVLIPQYEKETGVKISEDSAGRALNVSEIIPIRLIFKYQTLYLFYNENQIFYQYISR